MLIAEFYPKTTKIAAVLVTCTLEAGRRGERVVLHVKDKLEARAVARQLGATPWNF